MSSLSETRYLVEFIPIEDYALVKAESWIEEGLTVAEIVKVCRERSARASLFWLDDVAREKRLVLIPRSGLESGTLMQLALKAKEREREDRKPNGWDAVLGDEFG